MKRGPLFQKVQNHFRGNRFRIVEETIRQILDENGEVRILDCGGRADYWERLSIDLRPRVHITVLNFQSEIDLYPTKQGDLQLEEVAGDACDMPEYSDKSFDLTHSNSVIEHVGSYQNMKRFADETQRVGKRYFVQTPNFWFLVDPHYGVPFIHWLPDSLKIAAFTSMNVGYAQKCSFEDAMVRVDHTRIISFGMLRKLFPNGKIRRERLFGLPKSLMAIGPLKAK